MFPVGDADPTREQRSFYRSANDWLEAMTALVRPASRAASWPPSLPQDGQSNADTVLEENMALVVELYAGEVGSRDGVKLGDQVVVTADACRVLCPYPISAPLLA